MDVTFEGGGSAGAEDGSQGRAMKSDNGISLGRGDGGTETTAGADGGIIVSRSDSLVGAEDNQSACVPRNNDLSKRRLQNDFAEHADHEISIRLPLSG